VPGGRKSAGARYGEEVKVMAGKAGKSGGAYRSAVTGRFVTSRYGKSHPKTTVKESTKKSK
jgi:hypothetical protein